MRDRRPVDELSIEELERVLAIRRREARQAQLSRFQRDGRVVNPEATPTAPPAPHDPVEAALHAMSAPAQAVKPPPPAPARITFNGSGDAAPQFDEEDAPPAPVVSPRARRTIMDRLLLGVEIIAVVLIGVIALNLFGAINTLERETASAQALADEQRRAVLPTFAPTPTLRLEQVVLPGGHIYRAGAEPQFNFNEVPAHLHARVQAEWIQPVINRPPPTRETALSLIIPRLNLDGTIVQGVDLDALRQGVGQLMNGINPGDPTGNVVLAAHNDVYGQLFRHLDQLQPGDTMQIRTASQVHTYRVTGQRIVDPNETSVMQNRDGATLTLISCYPYQVNTHRIIVFADRIS